MQLNKSPGTNREWSIFRCPNEGKAIFVRGHYSRKGTNRVSTVVHSAFNKQSVADKYSYRSGEARESRSLTLTSSSLSFSSSVVTFS